MSLASPSLSELGRDSLPQAGDEDERGPLRRCIATREQGERAAMLRFVVGPDRSLVPDLGARLPGRGLWLSARADVLELALKRGAFARAARGSVTVPPALASMVIMGLARRVTDSLGMARRAGQAVGGFVKAREMVERGRAGVVVHASDGSEEEGRRLLSGAAGVPVVRPLTAGQLGTVFGREHLVHVAVLQGRLADGIRVEAARLAGMATGIEMMSGAVPMRRATIERIGE